MLTKASLVPSTALTDIAGKSVLFVREPDGDFEMHEIAVGESGVGDVEILSGLREGEADRRHRRVYVEEHRFEEHARRARGQLVVALLAWIVHWSLRNRQLVVMAALVFIVFGIHAAIELPLDAVPDVTNVQVQVITTAPALSPVEVEQYITVPVERSMAGIPHSTEVRSISKYSLSVVTIVFADGTDVYFARQLVNERMREAQDAVPRAVRSGDHGAGDLGGG